MTLERRWYHPAIVSEEDELALVLEALDGDAAARQALAQELVGVIQREVAFCLVRFAAAQGRDPRQDRLDLVQEVLVSLFEHDARELRRFDPQRGRSLRSFVQLVARRRVARILSLRKGNPWADAPTDPTVMDDDGDDTEVLRRLEQRSELQRVLGALHARMSPRDHELFDLLFLQERPPDEVASALGVSRGAVNAWAYRMRKVARALAREAEASPESSTAMSSPKRRVDGD